jgi:bifunctional non-homologous end joining protein LigD
VRVIDRDRRRAGHLRRETLEVRKTSLVTVLAGAGHGIWYNDHIEGDGQTVFRHACKLGLEGIVSKRKDSPYRSGRSPDWLKMKNPAHPAVKREEEDWAR